MKVASEQSKWIDNIPHLGLQQQILHVFPQQLHLESPIPKQARKFFTINTKDNKLHGHWFVSVLPPR